MAKYNFFHYSLGPKIGNVHSRRRALDSLGLPKVTESPATDPFDYLDYPLLCGSIILIGIIKLFALLLSNIFLQCAEV
jgi:hypothetical protein